MSCIFFTNEKVITPENSRWIPSSFEMQEVFGVTETKISTNVCLPAAIMSTGEKKLILNGSAFKNGRTFYILEYDIIEILGSSCNYRLTLVDSLYFVNKYRVKLNKNDPTKITSDGRTGYTVGDLCDDFLYSLNSKLLADDITKEIEYTIDKPVNFSKYFMPYVDFTGTANEFFDFLFKSTGYIPYVIDNGGESYTVSFLESMPALPPLLGELQMTESETSKVAEEVTVVGTLNSPAYYNNDFLNMFPESSKDFYRYYEINPNYNSWFINGEQDFSVKFGKERLLKTEKTVVITTDENNQEYETETEIDYWERPLKCIMTAETDGIQQDEVRVFVTQTHTEPQVIQTDAVETVISTFEQWDSYLSDKSNDFLETIVETLGIQISEEDKDETGRLFNNVFYGKELTATVDAVNTNETQGVSLGQDEIENVIKCSVSYQSPSQEFITQDGNTEYLPNETIEGIELSKASLTRETLTYEIIPNYTEANLRTTLVQSAMLNSDGLIEYENGKKEQLGEYHIIITRTDYAGREEELDNSYYYTLKAIVVAELPIKTQKYTKTKITTYKNSNIENVQIDSDQEAYILTREVFMFYRINFLKYLKFKWDISEGMRRVFPIKYNTLNGWADFGDRQNLNPDEAEDYKVAIVNNNSLLTKDCVERFASNLRHIFRASKVKGWLNPIGDFDTGIFTNRTEIFSSVVKKIAYTRSE